MIYFMVIDDIPTMADQNQRPVGEFSPCQPALAKANRQLRHEVLPIFYSSKSFGMRIYPKTHGEVDEVWNKFLGSFGALITGLDGASHLSHVQNLEVELWHPAPNVPRPGGLRTVTQSLPDHDNQPDFFPLTMSNGVYLHFGARRRLLEQTVGGEDTDWTDRDAVTAVLKTAIVDNRRYLDAYRLERFWVTYPFERLVDLVMMIAAECKEAGRVVRIGTSFAHQD